VSAQQIERISARQLGALGMHFSDRAAGHQPHIRLGGDDVVTRLAGIMLSAVEKHRPRPVSHGFKQCGTVSAVRQFSQQWNAHAHILICRAGSVGAACSIA